MLQDYNNKNFVLKVHIVSGHYNEIKSLEAYPYVK